MKNDHSSGILNTLIWASAILILGFSFLYVLRNFLLDVNKINAATNAANCQLSINKENLTEQPLICKYIFDSAVR
jgi:hypothetical protein